jgi:hypothetical protein
MIISCNNLGRFEPSNFDMTAFIANEFIPLVSVQNSFSIEDIEMYSKPSFEIVIRKPNTLKNIKDGFQYGHTAREIAINNRKFFIAKGVFFSEQRVPLMVCAMKKEAYFNPEVAKFSDLYNEGTFSYNNYVLFYSTSFYTDPSLTPLNRRLQKEILQSCYEKGIEVRILSSLEIEKNTFARLFEVKKTKSLTQLEAYMNQVLPNFLHNNGEDNFIEQEFAPVTIHKEGLSVEEEALLFDNEVRDLIVDSIQREAEHTIHSGSNLSLSLGSNLTTSTGTGITTSGHFTTTTVNTYTTTGLTMPPRQMTELEELVAEAAQYDPIEESSDEEESFDDDEDSAGEFYWGDAEHAVEIEEMLRDEETAHTVSTVSERSISIHTNLAGARMFEEALRAEVSNSLPHPENSLVERMRPLQNAYNVQMLQAQQRSQLQAEREGVRGWQSTIELIDDTE